MTTVCMEAHQSFWSLVVSYDFTEDTDRVPACNRRWWARDRLECGIFDLVQTRFLRLVTLVFALGPTVESQCRCTQLGMLFLGLAYPLCELLQLKSDSEICKTWMVELKKAGKQ